MEVIVAEESKLRRKLTVEVPLNEVRSVYNEVFGRLRSNIRVDGFRPGKYPRHLAEKRFKDAMSGEAMQTLVPKYFEQAVQQLNLRPATQPHFDNLHIDQQRPFKFDVEFEIVPEFTLLPPSAFSLEEEEIRVEDTDVDAQIENMRRSRASMEDKGDAPAAPGDGVVFDFEGTLNGEPFEGGSAQDQRIEIGGSEYLPDFQSQFEGIRGGEKRRFPLTFPEDYGEKSLAGQTVEFEVTAKSVEQRVLPELDPSFFAQFGQFETEAAFRDHVREQVLHEREEAQHRAWQERLAEQIREKYDFDVPETLVERTLEEFEHDLSHKDPEVLKDAEKLAQLKTQETENIRAGLRLNYVVDALATERQITADPEEVRQRFYMQAYFMRQNPTELLRSEMGERVLYQIERNVVTTRTLDDLARRVLGKPEVVPPVEASTETPAVDAQVPETAELEDPQTPGE